MKITDAKEIKIVATLRLNNALLRFNDKLKQCEVVENCWEFKTAKNAKKKLICLVNVECGINKEAVKSIIAFFAKKLELVKVIVSAENDYETKLLKSHCFELSFEFEEK